ncbi:hypothetical protein C1H46_014501 [Malus baccata]|uniref:Uncharacterized protein n=1 Tax=Malus baccata TaxID=106549 RepID=A0A540MM81_MALBA|nr:hypothetical protein C1H46_014501 [Malus baccata]
MRIQNSRSNFSQMTPPDTTPAAAHLRSQHGSDDCFVVEEENRRIGWSSYTKKEFPAQVSSKDQLHDEVEAASSTEIGPLNCLDKGKDVKHCMQMNTNPASEGQSEGEADKGKQFTACAGSQGGGEGVTSPVTAGIARPFSFSHLGNKLPFKKRRPYIYTATEVEMERDKVEDGLLEVKVEDAVMEAKERWVPVEVETENQLAEVKEDEPKEVKADVATADKEDESLKEGELREETEEETKKMGGHELFNEDEDYQRTQSIIRTVTCGSYVPHLAIDENQEDSKKEELGLEETAGEPIEKPRRGRKRRRSGASSSSDEPRQGRRELKRGRAKRMQDPVEANQGCVDIAPRRGRSKGDTEASFHSYNRGRRIVKPPPPQTSSVGSSEDPPAQQDEQEVSSLPFNGAIFLSYQRYLHDQSIKENTAGCVSEDKVISDSCAAQRRGNISNAAVPARQNVIVISSDDDEPALRNEKVDPDEVTSRRIRRRMDSWDVNMGSNCAHNEMTQAGHARVRTSGMARARGMHSLMRNLNLMPSRPRFEEELIKNVNGEAKNAQRKRFRLLSEFYGV